ncbi:unnamed protein product [Caretta caretta]
MCPLRSLILSYCVLRVWGIQSDSDNSFIQQQVQIAQILNISNCWVCSHIPAHSQASIPTMAIPLNSSELTGEPYPLKRTWKENDTWGLGKTYVPKLISVVKGKGHWCWVCNGTGLNLGRSSYLQYIVSHGVWDYSNKVGEWRTGYAKINFLSTWDQTKDSISCSPYSLPEKNSTIYKRHVNATSSPSENHPVPFGGYYSSFVNSYMSKGCSQPFPALMGHHWVCGENAYTVLPANWSGICYPAQLFPQFRVLQSLPRNRLRNFKRKRRDLPDAKWYVYNITPLTWEDAVGISLVPVGGVIHHAKRLLRLQAVVEIMANETRESLKALAKEAGAVRQVALQNRRALDIILAAKGGTCALIGTECCVYIPDNTNEVINRASHLEQIACLPHEEPSSLWKWISNLFNFSSLGNWLFQGILTILFGILITFVCFQLISCCIQNCTRHTIHQVTPNQSANLMLFNVTSESNEKERLMYGIQ